MGLACESSRISVNSNFYDLTTSASCRPVDQKPRSPGECSKGLDPTKMAVVSASLNQYRELGSSYEIGPKLNEILSTGLPYSGFTGIPLLGTDHHQPCGECDLYRWAVHEGTSLFGPATAWQTLWKLWRMGEVSNRI